MDEKQKQLISIIQKYFQGVALRKTRNSWNSCSKYKRVKRVAFSIKYRILAQVTQMAKTGRKPFNPPFILSFYFFLIFYLELIWNFKLAEKIWGLEIYFKYSPSIKSESLNKYYKSQMTSTKLQINIKSQYSKKGKHKNNISGNSFLNFCYLSFGIYLLFVIW